MCNLSLCYLYIYCILCFTNFLFSDDYGFNRGSSSRYDPPAYSGYLGSSSSTGSSTSSYGTDKQFSKHSAFSSSEAGKSRPSDRVSSFGGSTWGSGGGGTWSSGSSTWGSSGHTSSSVRCVAAHVYTYMHAHTHTHAHTYMHMHVHMCSGSSGADEAQKRFINAKSISSDQFFGRKSDSQVQSHACSHDTTAQPP